MLYMVEYWIVLFGLPNQSLSGNGGQFNNELVREKVWSVGLMK